MGAKEKAFDSFCDKFGKPPAHIARAPGRVNLLGEHVDYNDGFVLPAAIDQATYLAFGPIESENSIIWAADFSQQTLFSRESIQTKTTPDQNPLPGWGLYPAGVLWAMNEAGYELPSMEAVVASDVPRGSGLSSSASVEMAFAIAWLNLADIHISKMQMALLGQRAENKYVGVNCGIMDQFASACGEQDRVLFLDCRSLEWETVPISNDVTIVIADTMVRRALTGSEYNDRRASCEQAVKILQTVLPEIVALRDISTMDFEKFAHLLPEVVAKRARHIVEEIERTQGAVSLLKGGKVIEFGKLMNACHTSLRDLYEVSCHELDLMVSLAQSQPGCYGARLTGAGFGGCTVNLVAHDQAAVFAQELEKGFEKRTGRHPEIYICRANQGAEIIRE
jgi:galactokinase